MSDPTPKRRGRPPRDTVRADLWLPRPLVEAARAQAERHGVRLAAVIAEWAERGRVDP